MTKDTDILDFDFDEKQNNNIKEERRQGKKNRRKKKSAIPFFILLLLFLLAVSLNVAQYFQIKNQEKTISQLSSDYEGLVAVMNSDKYVLKEDAEKQLSEAIEEAISGKTYEGREEVRNEILAMFDNGDSILKILENLYFDKIVVPDGSGYYFFDIDENIAKHNLDFDKFIYPEYNEEKKDYEGELDYVEEGVTVKKGIDVSKFQGDINWNKVKKDGIDFVFMRCGFRGYETGKIVEDETFEQNIKECNDIGIDAGVYFFTEAKTTKEAVEEADFVIDLLNEYDATIQLPIVIDVEQSSNPSKSRTKNLTPEERTEIVIAFCERVKEAGYEPMIYGNLKSHMRMTDINQLEDYAKWFAYYRTPLRYPYKFDIWQYTSTGSVDGIKGEVDLNLMFVRE